MQAKPEPTMKDIVLFIAQQLVNNPDAVQVTETECTTVTLFELRVAQEDFGRVIGRYGRTVGATRVILNAVATRAGRRVNLEVIEEK